MTEARESTTARMERTMIVQTNMIRSCAPGRRGSMVRSRRLGLRAASVLALLLACLADCVGTSRRCETDRNCNPGRRCVVGWCEPAGDAAGGNPRGDGEQGDGRAERAPADSPDGNAGDAGRGGLDGESTCAADAEDCRWSPSRLPGLVLWL